MHPCPPSASHDLQLKESSKRVNFFEVSGIPETDSGCKPARLEQRINESPSQVSSLRVKQNQCIWTDFGSHQIQPAIVKRRTKSHALQSQLNIFRHPSMVKCSTPHSRPNVLNKPTPPSDAFCLHAFHRFYQESRFCMSFYSVTSKLACQQEAHKNGDGHRVQLLGEPTKVIKINRKRSTWN